MPNLAEQDDRRTFAAAASRACFVPPQITPAGRLFVITGPSGVGKGTLIRELLDRVPDLELSVSATTRPPRPGERDGFDYHFLSEEEFSRRLAADEFLEHASYAGYRYGTLVSEVEPRLGRGVGVVLEIEIQGARQVRERQPAAVPVFVAPPSPDALRERLEERGTDSPEAIERRLQVARAELDAQREFVHVIVNDDLARAADELSALVRAELAAA
jgi:guanylate kinase